MRFLACLAAAPVIACAGAAKSISTAATHTSEQTPAPRVDIRDLAIIPATKTACPGQSIAARYEAVLGDGSRVQLTGTQLSRLALRGIAADAAPDGSWTTAANPLESVVSGFRLSVSLATDPGVHADTVIVPAYNCGRAAVGLPISDRYHVTKARVRAGVFASPFYDSIVVAAVEPEGAPPIVVVLDPPRIHSRSVFVSATGKPGEPGRPGHPGNDGGPCESGSDGSDGDRGDAGEAGGQIDIVIQARAPWLESLVAVTNSGGRGGAGGRGGRGGRPGARTSDVGCSPIAGRSGKNGEPGRDGDAGPYPKITTVEGPLLWQSSPLWFDSTARANLQQLIDLSARRRSR